MPHSGLYVPPVARLEIRKRHTDGASGSSSSTATDIDNPPAKLNDRGATTKTATATTTPANSSSAAETRQQIQRSRRGRAKSDFRTPQPAHAPSNISSGEASSGSARVTSKVSSWRGAPRHSGTPTVTCRGPYRRTPSSGGGSAAACFSRSDGVFRGEGKFTSFYQTRKIPCVGLKGLRPFSC